jgi:hypothetical protein
MEVIEMTSSQIEKSYIKEPNSTPLIVQIVGVGTPTSR